MRHRIVSLGSNRPRLVLLGTLLLTLLSGALISQIRIDTDPENMLPEDQPDRAYHNAVRQRFSLSDAIVVGAVNELDPNGIYNPRSLSALHSLSTSILEMDGVVREDLMSLASVDNISQAGPGTVRFEWLMASAPRSAEQAGDIRRKVERLPLLMNTLVSGDGHAAAIYVPIVSKDESYRISEQIRQAIDQLDSDDRWHITGLPVAEDTFGVEMFVQMGISAPLAGLMIFVLMWWFFRNVRLVMAPMLVAMATVIITMGLLIGSGNTVHIMSSMIPIFLMPIAVVDSIHILSDFKDRYRCGDDAGKVIRTVVDDLFSPMLFTSLTSAVGFLSLALTPIPPVQVFGLFVAFGILLAFVLTVTVIPAWVVRMPVDSLASGVETPPTEGGDSAVGGASAPQNKPGPLTRTLRRTGPKAFAHARLILLAACAIVAVSIVGIDRIQINDNPVRWFKTDHRIRIADRELNAHFAGTYDAFYILEHSGAERLQFELTRDLQALAGQASRDGLAANLLQDTLNSLHETTSGSLDERINNGLTAIDDALFSADGNDVALLETASRKLEQTQEQARYFLRPEILAYIRSLQEALLDSGVVGKTSALPDLVQTVYRELLSGEPADYRLPDSSRGVAQTLLQFQSSHRPQDLWHMTTPNYSSVAIWMQLSSGDNQDMQQVMDTMDQWLAEHPLPDGVQGQWAGKTYLNVVWQEAMVNGMLKSLLGAFVVVFIMMVVLFRSLLFGLAAMLPLSITILFIYGLIGWMGKDYDMPVAVLSSLTLGLSVDFAIHFLERARALFREYPDFNQLTRKVFEEPGRAIARNAIVIAVGFTPLLFAPLVPYLTVGVFLASIMAISGLATLVLLPAVMQLLRRYMFPVLSGDKTPPTTAGGASARQEQFPAEAQPIPTKETRHE